MEFDRHIEPPAMVAVAMSGGVDSSLAAVLLEAHGYRVIGLTMRLWDIHEDGRSRCCSPQAFSDARTICHRLDIPHYILDLRRPFADKVVQPFAEEYLRGRTPNPCVLCNSDIKWNILLRKARALGAQALATGHYARVRWDKDRERFLLLRGRDRAKDQSYALWGLSQKALSETLFPLGGLTKTETRRLAQRWNLKVADKKDSQEICFIPDDDYGQFIKEWLKGVADRESSGWSPGPIVDRSGRVLGEHEGIPFYTIGQRRGLGLATGRPLYVLEIDRVSNRLVVGADDELLDRHLWADHLNWVSIEAPKSLLPCRAQIRYAHRAASMELIPLGEDGVHGSFRRPQRAITPGQSVVFYDDDDERLLGGGLIRRPTSQEAAAIPVAHETAVKSEK